MSRKTRYDPKTQKKKICRKMRLLSFLIVATSIQESVSTTCDILAKAGNPCVAAHSTVRALFADFDGPLYAVRRYVDVSLRRKK